MTLKLVIGRHFVSVDFKVVGSSKPAERIQFSKSRGPETKPLWPPRAIFNVYCYHIILIMSRKLAAKG